MTPLEKLRHLRELAANATPRPWEVRREAESLVRGAGGKHVAATSGQVRLRIRDHQVSGADADYIAAAANLLPALVDVAESCLAWAEDTGACHLCGLGALPAIARARFAREKQRQTEHDEDCPVLLLERALEADHG